MGEWRVLKEHDQAYHVQWIRPEHCHNSVSPMNSPVVTADSLEEIKVLLRLWLEACDKPVLRYFRPTPYFEEVP